MSNTPKFPQPLKTISLTNHVEFVKVDRLYGWTKNKFDMTTADHTKTIRQEATKFGINPGKYSAWAVIEILDDGFKLTPIEFSDTPKSRQILFFVNKSLTQEKHELEVLLFELWRTNSGGSRFPYIMPSRNKTFR